MGGGVRIFVGRALRWFGLFGLVVLVPATALGAIFSDVPWMSILWMVLCSTGYAVVGHLLVLWGLNARVRRDERRRELYALALRKQREQRERVTALVDWPVVDQMMAATKKAVDAREAGDTGAAEAAQRELDVLMEKDPVTAQRFVQMLHEGDG